MTPTIAEAIQKICPDFKAQEPLSKHTTLGIGGPADFYAGVTSIEQLAGVMRLARQERLRLFVLGAGSNLLFADAGFRGLVLHLEGQFREFQIDGEDVQAGAGAWVPALVKRCAEAGLEGIEALIGVPASIGGALVMNAGTREGEIGPWVEWVQGMDENGALYTLAREKLCFSYRHSNLEDRLLVRAGLRLKRGDRTTIMNRIQALLQYRAGTQPLATSNCGSVFKNPPGDFAARLIEKAGLKGYRRGQAQVSDRHANFILNLGNARAEEVQGLVDHIRQTVKRTSCVDLELELKIVGP